MKYLAPLAVLLLAGCSSIPSPFGSKPTCADTFAAQMVTPQIVPGAFGCLSPAAQAQFESPANLAAYSAQEPVIQSTRLLGRSDGGAYVYAAHTSQGPGLFLIKVDANGKVAGVRGMAG